MPRAYTTTELKLISNEEVIELDDEGNEIKSFEIEAVLNHRGPPKNREYLVRWKNYSSEWDEWLTADKFNDPNTLRKYWKNIGEKYASPKNAKVNTSLSSETLRNAPPGTISTLMESLPSDDSNSSTLADTSQTSSNITSKRLRPDTHTVSGRQPTNVTAHNSKRPRRHKLKRASGNTAIAPSTRSSKRLHKSSL